jgi:hypothetical protein
MSGPGLFKDLGKRVSDLLTKEFPTDEKKVEWKGVTNNNVTIETNLLQKGDGAIVGTITPSYKYKEYGLNVLAEINTKKDVKLEASVENKLADGLKLTLTGESRGDTNFATVAAEYRHEYATVNGSIDYGKPKGSLVKANTVFGQKGFALGLSAEYFLGTTDQSELKTFNTTIAYGSKDFDATVFGRLISEKDKNELGGTYYHNINPTLAVGTEVVFDTANAESKPKLSFGTNYKLNDDTSIKGRFDTNGILGVSFAQRFNKNSRAIIGANIDTNNLSGKSSSSFGYTVSLSS